MKWVMLTIGAGLLGPTLPATEDGRGTMDFAATLSPIVSGPVCARCIKTAREAPESSLRFGSRELAIRELLATGPGDVLELDRTITDPVDLVVGDKIVARGEVVLVNGNFGLRVTEVAEPRKCLESVRCLF